MTDRIESFQDDLSWLRSLAESGRAAPLQTGPFLVAAGAWFGGASLVLALHALGTLALPPALHIWIWIAAVLGNTVTLVLLLRRESYACERGANRLINATWSAAGIGILIYWLAASLLAWRLDNGLVLATMPLAVMSIYGLVWWIKGSLTGIAWMHGLALVSFAFVVLMALAIGSPLAWLTYSGALFATALIPGLYLILKAPHTG